jgi:hypothetical protein
MLPNHWKWAMSVVLFSSIRALAADGNDAIAYCSYEMQQALAQRDLLRTPIATGGLTQPETGLPVQIVGGGSLGLSNFRKGGLSIDLAHRNCELYKATTAAQQNTQYALPSLEKDALTHRLILIDEASKALSKITEQTQKMVQAQNATRMMLFTLQTTKIKLETDRADTQAKIATLYIPQLNDKTLKDLVADKQNHEASQQQALDKLSRQNNWDVALSVGVHQQVNPVAYGPQPYGAVTISYNLASHAIDRHLDQAAEAYAEWRKVQEGDVVRNVQALHQQLLDTEAAQESKLKSLDTENSELDKSLQLVANPDTSAALDFRNQLTSAQLLLQIETGDARFRLDQVKEYLAKNY